MMIDGKGCALILALLAVAGFILGLLAFWLGAPGWAPLAAALGVPGGLFAAYGLLLAWDALKQRIGR